MISIWYNKDLFAIIDLSGRTAKIAMGLIDMITNTYHIRQPSEILDPKLHYELLDKADFILADYVDWDYSTAENADIDKIYKKLIATVYYIRFWEHEHENE